MAFGAGGLVPPVAFEAGLLRGPEGRRVMGIMVYVVMTGGAGVFQPLNVKSMRDRDIIGIDFR